MKSLLLTVGKIALLASAIGLAYADDKPEEDNPAKQVIWAESAVSGLPKAAPGMPWAAVAVRVGELETAAQQGDLKAQVELALKYEHAEGVPRDLSKAHNLYCQAATRGNAEAEYRLGWMYANGRGVSQDDGVAAALFWRAADRGYTQAAQLLNIVRPNQDVTYPTCLLPKALPVATAMKLPPAHLTQVAEYDTQRPIIAPKEIIQLVQRLAPEYAIDSNLALALISVESGFNSSALSPAKAQGLMQLIPETAERFGVKNAFSPDENIKGGLAYLRWLLAFFEGDVSLVLAAYNAGEGAVEKFRGIPPYAETQDYVRKITGMYKRATHPYNPNIVKPSSLVAQLKRLQ